MTTRSRPRKAARTKTVARKKAKRPAAKAAKASTPAPKKRAKAADPHAAVRRYRERMRAKGYRPMTMWVPDVQNPAVARKLKAEFAAIREHERTSAQARSDAAFWNEVAAHAWDDLPDYDWGPDGPPKG
jgi:hypothetical protein